MIDFGGNFWGKTVKLRARNPNLGSSEVLLNSWVNSTVRWASIFDADYALDITSSNVNDTGAGTGARTATIYGLDKDWNQQTESITLAGQTIVTTTKKYIRVFEIVVDTAGSGFKNAGDIYVVKTGTGGVYTGGVPGTVTGAVIKLLAGENYGLSGMWSAPRGSIYRLEYLLLSARSSAGLANLQHGYPYNNGLVYPRLKLDFTEAGSPSQMPIPGMIIVREKEDLYITGQAAVAGTAIISIDLILSRDGRA